MEKRLLNLKKKIDSDEGYLILNAADIKYLSEMKSSNIALLITQSKQYVLTDGRYQHMVQSQQLFEPVILQKGLMEGICDFAQTLPFSKLILEAKDIIYQDYLTLKSHIDKQIVKGQNFLGELRLIKNREELDCIQKAQQIAEKAYLEVLNEVQVGNTSKRIASKLDYFMNLYGSEEPAFETIVVSGKDTVNCHGVPNDRQIENGDFVLFDFGATYHGYRSDMTRTIGVGALSEEKQKIYMAVLEAHNLALQAVKPGIEARTLDQIARDHLNRLGYTEFLHSLGHGVGLDIHEQPAVSAKSSVILKQGMVITIEPGIYVEGIGGVRIEDTVAVTENGYFSFASVSKELIIV